MSPFCEDSKWGDPQAKDRSKDDKARYQQMKMAANGAMAKKTSWQVSYGHQDRIQKHLWFFWVDNNLWYSEKGPKGLKKKEVQKVQCGNWMVCSFSAQPPQSFVFFNQNHHITSKYLALRQHEVDRIMPVPLIHSSAFLNVSHFREVRTVSASDLSF